MSLWETATSDLANILQDTSSGFARIVELENPAGQVASVPANCNDIGQTVDTETGMLVSARYASCVFARAALVAANIGFPVGIKGARPWIVRFSGVDGVVKQYHVIDTPTDDIGSYVCSLKRYDT